MAPRGRSRLAQVLELVGLILITLALAGVDVRVGAGFAGLACVGKAYELELVRARAMRRQSPADASSHDPWRGAT